MCWGACGGLQKRLSLSFASGRLPNRVARSGPSPREDRGRCTPGAGAGPFSQREWEAQYPYSAHPAKAERITVGRERAHSMGVESTSQTVSSWTREPRRRAAHTQVMVAVSEWTRLL